MPAESPLESDAPPAADEHAAQLRRLSLYVRQAPSFRLAIALYNDPLTRKRTIEALAGELAPQGVRILILDLHGALAEHTLLGRIEELAKSVASSPGERLAMMVVNLESRIDYTPETAQPGGPGLRFLETANLHRDLFPGVFSGPVVLWVTELLEDAIIRHAPDLWRWRSHRFDLRTAREPATPLKSERNLLNHDFRLHPDKRLQRLAEELAGYRQLVKAGNPEFRFDECRVLNSMGLARLDLGDARGARRDFEAAAELAKKIGNRRAEANALGNLGIAHASLGDVRKAIEYHEQCRVIAKEIGDRRGEGAALGNLGNAHAALGDARKAIEYHEQCRVIAKEIGDRLGEGNALGNLGNAHANLGDARKAMELYEQCLVVAKEIGDRLGEGNALGNLGNVHSRLGDARKAIKFYEQQHLIVKETGDRRGEGTALWNSADEFWRIGERAEAFQRARAALAIYEAIEDPYASKVRAALVRWRDKQD